jgi:hypothetical protein
MSEADQSARARQPRDVLLCDHRPFLPPGPQGSIRSAGGDSANDPGTVLFRSE